MENNINKELEWNDTIENESNFEILPEGDYTFVVKSFERRRHENRDGRSKIPSCNKAILTLEVDNPDLGTGIVTLNLFLVSKMEWKLCEFFTSIGQRKRGEKLAMNWDEVPGSVGYCHISIYEWIGDDGKSRQTNRVEKCYDPTEISTQKNEYTGSKQKHSHPTSFTEGVF